MDLHVEWSLTFNFSDKRIQIGLIKNVFYITHKLISNCSMSYGWKHTKCVVKEMTIFKLNLFSDQYDMCLSLLTYTFKTLLEVH